MQDYQEEYLANLRQFAGLSQRQEPEGLDCGAYTAELLENREEILRLSRRNMALLRQGLFPLLDDLFRAEEERVKELEEFSFQLFDGRVELDVGLFCQIHQALLTLARHNGDRDAEIRELYWLGMGQNSVVSKLVGLELKDVWEYNSRMRLCFAEAADCLKYYDEISDNETLGYILRSRANMSLGQFPTPGEKISLIKQTLNILQDKRYREKAPELPWDRFVYLTHQNMTSSISHSRKKVMSPEEMAAIMESAYIVYQRRFDEGARKHQQPPAKSAFGYHAIEFYCGLYGLDTFLSKLEGLLEEANPCDYSSDGMYAMVSLPAFYCQYLSQYPEKIPPRRDYLEALYRRTLDYIEAYPSRLGDRGAFLYLRQLCFTFVETEGGIPYTTFLQKLMLRFAPEMYRHSYIVGEGAKALCAAVLENEPGSFDEIDFIGAVTGAEEKKTVVLDYAMGCGLYHDVGKVSVIELYTRTARQWFAEEYEMAHLHTLAGRILLEGRPSTSRYAPIALGHHAWYDGSQGYPAAYKRPDCPARLMVDVISLVDFLEIRVNSAQMYNLAPIPFEEAVREIQALEGKRFSPVLTARLRDRKTAERIRTAMEAGTEEACRRMYKDALQAG